MPGSVQVARESNLVRVTVPLQSDMQGLLSLTCLPQSQFIARMLCVACLCGYSVPGLAKAEGCTLQDLEDFQPYRATVVGTNALVYAGPGNVHYATEQLDVGDEVEVYGHDPGGWCAIRPPANSFSMVLAENIELLSEQVARVTKDGTKCWVGTSLDEPEQPLWQVRLKQGEKLQLIGFVREQYVLEADQPDWIQVAPPRGEFRWVHQSQIKYTAAISPGKNPAVAATQTGSPKSSSTLSNRSLLNELHRPDDLGRNDIAIEDQINRTDEREFYPTSPDEFDIVDGIPQGNNPQLFQAVHSDSPKPGQSIDNGVDGWRAAVRPLSEIMPELVAQHQYDHTGHSANDAPYARERVGQTSPQLRNRSIEYESRPIVAPQFDPNQPFSSIIQRLELDLTQQVIQEPLAWRLEPLIAECRHVIQNSNDQVERARAERLLDKTLQFQRVQSNYMVDTRAMPVRTAALDSGQFGAPSFNQFQDSPQAVGSQLNSNSISSESTLAGNYDVVGILNELVRDNGRAKPTYVLQDEQGKILHHVAASPGVNLHRYLKKSVAIKGQLGYHRQLNLSHITAEEVFEIRTAQR